MPNLDYPSINVSKKTNEENIQAAKGWMMNTADSLNLQLTNLSERISRLEKLIEEKES